MPARRYVEENGSAAPKRLAGVALEVNLKECILCTPPPSANKAAKPGFETQSRRHQKSKNRGINGPHKKHLRPPIFFKKKSFKSFFVQFFSLMCSDGYV